MQLPQDLGDKVQAKLAELKTLKDQIKVNVHLASMQLREEWKKLEARLPDTTAVGDQLKGKAADTLDRLTQELQEFSAKLRRGH